MDGRTEGMRRFVSIGIVHCLPSTQMSRALSSMSSHDQVLPYHTCGRECFPMVPSLHPHLQCLCGWSVLLSCCCQCTVSNVVVFISAGAQQPTFFSSMTAWKTQNPLSNATALPVPQIDFVNLMMISLSSHLCLCGQVYHIDAVHPFLWMTPLQTIFHTEHSGWCDTLYQKAKASLEQTWTLGKWIYLSSTTLICQGKWSTKEWTPPAHWCSMPPISFTLHGTC